MTVNKLFLLIIRLLFITITPYWLIHLFVLNNGLNTFDVSFDQNKFFVLSLALFIIYFGFHFIVFIIYLLQNNSKSIAIVFSYKYLKENYWKDVNKAFD